ncbi:O-fucosyltransferase 14 [Vigna angularis]|uniref:O-fucosyltransferase 14 n=1 Tax=Phaseolus angularis TaxID=3914 RepID=A0A8T0KJU1_PHAAN|nr:O-fucosyltransferase 14 [Vigna angularis]
MERDSSPDEVEEFIHRKDRNLPTFSSIHRFNINAYTPATYLYFRNDSCGTVDQNLRERRTIEWRPKANKFLVAVSNVDYEYERVLDVEHMNKCIGGKVKAVISFQEFSSMRMNGKHEGKFLCYFSLPQPCCLDEEHLRKLKSLGLLSTNKPATAWDEDARKPRTRSVEEAVSRFSQEEKEDVLAIGDVLYANVEEE